jgi:hypothetical protein
MALNYRSGALAPIEGGAGSSGILRGVRAVVGVSELQCFYLFEKIHVKLDLVNTARN